MSGLFRIIKTWYFDFPAVEQNIWGSRRAVDQPLTRRNWRWRGRCVDWWVYSLHRHCEGWRTDIIKKISKWNYFLGFCLFFSSPSSSSSSSSSSSYYYYYYYYSYIIIIIIIIIIIVVVVILSFMQDISTYIPETNYVTMEYSVAAILLLLFMVLISLVPVSNLLYFYISTFRSVCVCSAQYGCFL